MRCLHDFKKPSYNLFFRNGMSADKQFVLDKEDAAQLLQDIVESLKEKDAVRLDGNEWQISQPIGEQVPLRIFSNGESLEITFKIEKREYFFSYFPVLVVVTKIFSLSNINSSMKEDI